MVLHHGKVSLDFVAPLFCFAAYFPDLAAHAMHGLRDVTRNVICLIKVSGAVEKHAANQNVATHQHTCAIEIESRRFFFSFFFLLFFVPGDWMELLLLAYCTHKEHL